MDFVEALAFDAGDIEALAVPSDQFVEAVAIEGNVLIEAIGEL